MLPYVARRLLWMVPTLLGIVFFAFVLLRLVPGDPAELAALGPLEGAEARPGGAAQEAIERFRSEHLLDQPLWRQFLHFLGPFDLSGRGHPWFGGSGERPWGGLALADLGSELHRPHVLIRDELARRLRVTVPLSLAAVLVSYAIALPLGIFSAVKRGAPLERASAVLVLFLYSVPAFWAGLLLQLAFGASGLGWLPVLGLHAKDAEQLAAGAYAWDLMRHAVLPVACLSYGSLAYLSRQMRAGMIEAIGADYVRTARAKGLPERTVVLKHALRNSLIPVATLFAAVLPALIGGSVIVETIFDLPGMGKYAFEALLQRDYAVVLATTALSAVLTCLGMLLSDLACAALDPRIRHG